MNRDSLLATGLALGIVLLAGLTMASCVARKAQEAAAGKVAVAEGKIQVLSQNLAESNTQLAEANTATKTVAAENVKLKAALSARPKPAPRPPMPDLTEREKDLKEAGIATKLAEHETELAWAWHEDAAARPGLEGRLEAAENLIQGQDKQIEAQRVELVRAGVVIKAQDQLLDSRAAQAQALQDQVNAYVKSLRVEGVKRIVYTVGGVAVGFLGGKASR